MAAGPRSPVPPRAPRGPVLGGCTPAGRCPSVPPGSGVWGRAVRRHHSDASTPWAPLARDRGAAVRVCRPRLLLLHPPGTGMGAGVAGGAGPPAAAARQVRARRSTAGHHLGRGGRLLCRGWARRSAEVCTGRRPDVVVDTPSELLERCPAPCPCGRGLGTPQVDQLLPSERSRQVWGGSLTNEGAVPRGATAAADVLVTWACQWATTGGGEPASVIRRWRVDAGGDQPVVLVWGGDRGYEGAGTPRGGRGCWRWLGSWLRARARRMNK